MIPSAIWWMFAEVTSDELRTGNEVYLLFPRILGELELELLTVVPYGKFRKFPRGRQLFWPLPAVRRRLALARSVSLVGSSRRPACVIMPQKRTSNLCIDMSVLVLDLELERTWTGATGM